MSDAESAGTVELRGVIDTFWEQGMDSIDKVFLDDADPERTGQYELKYLERDDVLTIFSRDRVVLWSGSFERPRKVLGIPLPHYSDYHWSPHGVSRDEWESWFKQKPPLPATLRTRRPHLRGGGAPAPSCA